MIDLFNTVGLWFNILFIGIFSIVGLLCYGLTKEKPMLPAFLIPTGLAGSLLLITGGKPDKINAILNTDAFNLFGIAVVFGLLAFIVLLPTTFEAVGKAKQK